MDVDAESDTPRAGGRPGPVGESGLGSGVGPGVDSGVDATETTQPLVPTQARPADEPKTEPERAATEPGPAEPGSAQPVSAEPGSAEPVEPDAPAATGPLPVRMRPTTTVRVFRGIGRSVLALISAALLALAGYNWSILHQLDSGIARTDLFGGVGAAPTGGRAAGPAVPPLTSDVNILVVGMDSRTDPHGNPLPGSELAMLHAGPDSGELDTDTMILVHVPAGGQQAVAISFPRDSYVQIAGGFGRHRLNSAFAYAHNQEASRLRAHGEKNAAQIEQQADTAGRKNLIATIENLIGNTITINRYAEINLVGFYDLSRAVGGVEVCLKAPTHDSETGASFPAGVQTISGVQALNFVRERHGLPGGDLDRITRQQVFLGALANKMLSTGTLTSPSRIAALTRAIQNSVTLSSGWDVTSFAEQMHNLSSGAIQFRTIPTGPNVTIGGADVTQVDPAAVRQFVEHLVRDTETTPASTPSSSLSSSPSSSPAATTTSPPVQRPGAPVTHPTAPVTTPKGAITAQGVRCVN